MAVTWTPSFLPAILLISLVTMGYSLPSTFQSKKMLVPDLESTPLTQRQTFGEMCRNLCTGPTRYMCPIGCRVSGLYSSKRNFGGIFDFNSRERNRAQSFDDKMFMELLGRKYNDMA